MILKGVLKAFQKRVRARNAALEREARLTVFIEAVKALFARHLRARLDEANLNAANDAATQRPRE